MKDLQDKTVDLILRDGPWSVLKSTEMAQRQDVSSHAGGAPEAKDEDNAENSEQPKSSK